jgi:hypothetical protein
MKHDSDGPGHALALYTSKDNRVTIVCRCGWGANEPSAARARKSYLQHARASRGEMPHK